jgi:hypothetical protein
MDEDIPLPFELPAVARKKVSVGFDGGRMSRSRDLCAARGPSRRRRSMIQRAFVPA